MWLCWAMLGSGAVIVFTSHLPALQSDLSIKHQSNTNTREEGGCSILYYIEPLPRNILAQYLLSFLADLFNFNKMIENVRNVRNVLRPASCQPVLSPSDTNQT